MASPSRGSTSRLARLLSSCEQGRPVISLTTTDCAGDAERLKAKGVVFVKEPGRMDYGGMDAVFDDTCGNLINLHQD